MKPAIPTLLASLALVVLGHAQGFADPNEGTILTRASDGTCTLSWWGRAGKSYFIQQSNDLIRWKYLPVIEPGSDGVVETAFTSSAPRLFLRLLSADVPTDNPLTADFDADGLNNQAEVQCGTDPFANDAGLDFDSDGLTNAEEYWLGTKLGEAASSGVEAAASVGLVVHTDFN